MAAEGFAHGLDEIWLGDDPLLEYFTIEAYTLAAHQAILAAKPSVFWMGATPNGRDLAGRLAVRLRTGLNADCTDLYINPGDERLVCEVSGFGGGVLALIEMASHRPQMATVRPGVLPAGRLLKTARGKLSPGAGSLRRIDRYPNDREIVRGTGRFGQAQMSWLQGGGDGW